MNIMPDIPVEKLKNIRNYFYEYALIILCFVVGFLFKSVTDLGNDFREHLRTDCVEMIKEISKNSEAIQKLKQFEK